MLLYNQTSRAGNQHRAGRLGLSSAQTTKSNGQLSTKAEAYGHNNTHNKLIKVSLKKKKKNYNSKGRNHLTPA